MTVEKLIEVLKTMPQDWPIYIYDCELGALPTSYGAERGVEYSPCPKPRSCKLERLTSTGRKSASTSPDAPHYHALNYVVIR
jgi:hypothetical protein